VVAPTMSQIREREQRLTQKSRTKSLVQHSQNTEQKHMTAMNTLQTFKSLIDKNVSFF
jgi:hypothetical protein